MWFLIAVQESEEVHPAPWVSEVTVPYWTSSVFQCCPSQLLSRALDTCFAENEPQKIPSINLKRSAFILPHTEQLFYFPDFPSPLQALGSIGVQCFPKEMPGVILAFMTANIIKVDGCQGHTPGDTFSQQGSTNCEFCQFPLIFYTATWRTDAQVSLCRSLLQWVWYAVWGAGKNVPLFKTLWVSGLLNHKFRKLHC